MARLSLHLLGPFQLTLDGKPVTSFRSDKVRALFAYLVVENDRPHRREKLAGLLWPEYPDQAARANLRRALADLRQAVDDHHATPPLFDISRQTIQFNTTGDAWNDVMALTDLLESGPALEETIHRLEEAVSLYRGDFLEGFSISNSPAFEEWLLLNRERLRRQILEALQRLAEHYEKRGEYRHALQYAWRQVELEPWRERAHRQLMRLLTLTGQRSAALAQYETCRRLLTEELGVEPAVDTTRLYEQIRDGEIPASPVVATQSLRSSSPPPSTHLPRFLSEDAPACTKNPVFVGRERELGYLMTCLETMLKGNSSVAFVTGSAGQGKTTLLDAFARRAIATHPDLLVATGNCSAYSGLGDPYLPFRDVMAMLTGSVEAKWAAGVITKEYVCRLWNALPDVMQLLVGRGPELVGIFLSPKELIARAAAATPDGAEWLERLKTMSEQVARGVHSLEQGQLFEQYANVLSGLAAQHPLLIMLDDLQWADAASVSLLFHLGRRINGSRILIVGAYRPDEVALGRNGQRHPLRTLLCEFKRYFGDTHLDLENIDETEARQFIEALLATEPNRLGEDFRQALFRRTRGHPMFTVELIREMCERGNLVQDETGYWVENPVLDWQTLPARVEGVIEERIGRLDPELRRILTIASVEGEEFTAQVVARVQQTDERDLLRKLSQNLEKRHRIVREQEEIQIGHRHLSRYQFTCGLFQQYLYRQLGAGERRLLHREIAAVLEELYTGHTEEIAVQLAHHYAGDVERERHYARVAGERAATQFANAEALRYLSRALELTPQDDLTERYAILLSRERVLDLQGEREAQREDLVALEHLAKALDEGGDGNGNESEKQPTTERQMEVALRWARYTYALGDYPATISAAQKAIRLAQVAQDTNREATGHLWWGRALRHLAEYEPARLHLEQALTLARRADARQVEADSLHNLGLLSWLHGDYAVAWTYSEQALHIYRQIGDRRSESITLNTFGIISSEQGDHTKAQRYLEQTLRIAREIGDRYNEGLVLGNIGLCYAERGDYTKARDYFEHSLHIRMTIGDRVGMCGTLSNLGQLAHETGDYESAQEYSEQALRIAREIGSRRWQGYALTNLGRTLESAGRLTEAAEFYRQALALRRETGHHQLAMDGLAGLARISLAQGNLTQAHTYVQEILDHLEENSLDGIEEPFRVYMTCYRVLRTSQVAQARDILETAYRLLHERAAKIASAELRRSFLENVASHYEVAREWRTENI